MAYLGPEPTRERGGEHATTCDYVGRKPCGCYTVWINGQDPPAAKTRLIAKLKREGYEVFPCRHSWARENVSECHCEAQTRLDIDLVQLRGGRTDG